LARNWSSVSWKLRWPRSALMVAGIVRTISTTNDRLVA
jgi:hypothetical protein